MEKIRPFFLKQSAHTRRGHHTYLVQGPLKVWKEYSVKLQIMKTLYVHHYNFQIVFYPNFWRPQKFI